MNAQEPRFIFDNDSLNQILGTETPVELPQTAPAPNPNNPNDTISFEALNKILPEISAWHIDPRFGERTPVVFDTLYQNYNQKSLVDGKGVAVGYLSNWGSPAQSKIFFERNETSRFNFLDPFGYYLRQIENHTFLDTKQPYSNFLYHSGGGRQNKEEVFSATMSLSFNKKFTLGFNIDYVYARGFYEDLANKQTNYDVFSSYITDKYQMHAYFAQNNYTNSENGGLVIPEVIPENFFDENAKELEHRFGETWNKLRGRQFFMTHKYSIGFEDEEAENFIPVASAILTTNYRDQKRTFTSNQMDELDKFYNYEETPAESGPNLSPTNTSSENSISTSSLNDRMSYYSLKNTLAVSLNEGFRKWVKFGLTAFIEHDIHKYAMPGVDYKSLTSEEFSESSTTFGGLLSKRQGDFLRYNVSAELGIAGYNSGDTKLEADVSTRFTIFGKEAVVKANAYMRNTQPTFFQNNFSSRYYNWENDFDKVKRTFIGGEIYVPSTKTKLSGGVENISDYIYYDHSDLTKNIIIKQHDDNINIFTLRLDQKLNAGILHFDNQLVYQKSSNQDVLPLPELSIYTNLYLQFKIAKVLDVQFGGDAHLHTRYYAPGYDPALLQFYNQRERKIGNFPFSTIYANFHLKKTRFFVMMYNAGTMVTDRPYLTLHNYAVNPMVFKFGLTWNFTN